MNRHRARSGRLAASLVLTLMCLYFLLPIYWLVVASTKDNSGLFAGSSGSLWFDSRFHLFDNLSALVSYDDGIYLRWLGNSLLYAFAGGVGATAIAVLAGYGLAKFDFRGRGFASAVLLGSITIPLTALVIPTFVLLSSAGLINTVWAVILPSCLSPIGVFLMRVYVQDSVPNEIIESARVDGAGEWRILLRVALPLLRPAVVTVLLLSAVGTWNNFFLPLAVLTSPELLPVTVGLQGWQTQSAGAASAGGQLWSLITTGSLVSIVPLVIAFLSLQRFWRGGLALGAIK
ncbi:carbohydrate ABC transporter permease [Dactylosporangium sp. CA-233914]|uniref:carbohydrate ABC transporter permease n=1 Tax=Dactylosporangium sp. CA-233914 TaxID=3239934 RepID=UPI003D8F89F6